MIALAALPVFPAAPASSRRGRPGTREGRNDMPAPFAPSATMAPGPVGALRLLAAFRREQEDPDAETIVLTFFAAPPSTRVD